MERRIYGVLGEIWGRVGDCRFGVPIMKQWMGKIFDSLTENYRYSGKILSWYRPTFFEPGIIFVVGEGVESDGRCSWDEGFFYVFSCQTGFCHFYRAVCYSNV